VWTRETSNMCTENTFKNSAEIRTLRYTIHINLWSLPHFCSNFCQHIAWELLTTLLSLSEDSISCKLSESTSLLFSLLLSYVTKIYDQTHGTNCVHCTNLISDHSQQFAFCNPSRHYQIVTTASFKFHSIINSIKLNKQVRKVLLNPEGARMLT